VFGTTVDMYYTRLLENIVLPLGDKILGTNFISELRKWRTVATFSRENIQRLQSTNLKDLMEHSLRSIPYYKSLNIKLSGHPYDDIKKFPLLTKPILRQEGNSLHHRKASTLVVERSSGSSGEQGEVYMSKKERSQVQAAQVFLWEWSGYKLGEKILQTGMTLNRGIVKSCKDSLFRTRYVSAYDLSDEKLSRYLQKAKMEDCEFLGGYAGSLNSLAKVAIDKKIDVKFKSVISWGDKLFDHYKKKYS
jgi:phenylacetate-CoA ligase